ncbi:hypothetical protein NHX12_018059 [Muraenolepis orangiensis]|uniref:GRF-type domain-containing protein n=1 Tax=Muraenolepis orangiensis TaxID=630683 RepID=A0A9Q0IV29_9TELE|nr:hypothetical protein NHX12_018059 [Muraenolepis orangiensis]
MRSKPLFGNAGVSNEEKKEDMGQGEASKSVIATCSKIHVPLSECTKENANPTLEPFREFKSLVSPRTLLKGTTTTLLGNGTAAGKRMSVDLFSPVLVNAPVQRNNGHSLVLCPTTVGRTSHLPQVNRTFEPRAAVPGHTKDDMETCIAVKTEECYGCYDYVVCDGDDITTDLYEENGLLDPEDMSCMNRDSSLSNVPKYINSTIPIPHQINVISNNYLAKTVCVERNGIAQKLVASNGKRLPSFIPVNEIRRPLNDSLANTSVLNLTSNRPKVVSSNVHLKVQNNSKNKSKTWSSSSLITPERALVSKVFTKPRPAIIQHNTTTTCLKKLNGKGTGPFIYSDAAATSSPTAALSLCTPQRAIPSLPSYSTSSRSCQYTTRPPSLLHPPRPRPLKITAPLCGCGRRAKRQTVCNGGPNHGRGFFGCPVRRSGTGNVMQNCCRFFKWESALIQESPPALSCVQSSMSLHVVRRPQLSLTSRKSY